MSAKPWKLRNDIFKDKYTSKLRQLKSLANNNAGEKSIKETKSQIHKTRV